MRKLKNWTITAKAVKHGQNGLFNYVNYLTDNERHKGQVLTEIHNENTLKNLIQSHNDFELQNKLDTKRHKGGRPSNVGWSAQLSYPFDITIEQFEVLRKRILFDFYTYVNEVEKLNMNNEDISNLIDSTIGVIHSGNNVNNHIHMIFNKVMPKRTNNTFKKDTMKLASIDLTKKKFSYHLKLINDKAIEDILKINKADYTIKTHEKPQKKRKTRIQIKMEKLEKQEKTLIEREKTVAKREATATDIMEKAIAMRKSLEDRVKAYNDQVAVFISDRDRMKLYALEQFNKDIDRHSEYMTKGMTQKAEKLRTKINSKIEKSENTIKKSTGMKK